MNLLDKTERFKIVGLLLLITLSITIVLFYKNYLLNKGETKETYAIYIGHQGGVGHSNEYFRYTNEKGEIVEGAVAFNHKDLDLNDTVWIRYSLFDNNVIEVIDMNYKRHMVK
jgi:hypothetical protein